MTRTPFLSVVLAALLATPAAAETGLVKPGVTVVPFRDYKIGRGRVVNEPPADYVGTCWRVTYVRGHRVGIELVKGVFKPHWEGGKSFTKFSDETVLDGYGKYRYDLAKGEFSIFRVGPCH